MKIYCIFLALNIVIVSILSSLVHRVYITKIKTAKVYFVEIDKLSKAYIERQNTHNKNRSCSGVITSGRGEEEQRMRRRPNIRK
jgi:hypothetical protein